MRYTSIGFKRTHLEAGFDEPEPSTSDTQASPSTVPSAETPKKKRKRGKPKPASREEDASHTEATPIDGAPTPSKPSKMQKMRKDFKDKKKMSEERRLKRVAERHAETVCYACREKGHSVRDCPTNEGKPTERTSFICYRCGSKKHSLSKCPKPVPEDVDKRLPFASCFVCQGKGHLAGQCPENKAKGVYPNGGCCKVCGQTDHLARDCGLRQSDVQKDRLLVGQGRDAGADEDDFHVVSRRKKEVDAEEGADAKPKGKIKRLVGGKIIIRVDDEPPKPKPVAKPAAPKVKTVYF